MRKSKSSQQWLQRQQNDPYVQKAHQEGYRCRAVYKLKQLNEKDRFIKQGNKVVDLGAAPGGWSQVLKELVGKKGKVIALDILPIEPIEHVHFIQGDFTEQSTLDELTEAVLGQVVDVVVSDMAPNTSGLSSVDQPRAMYLAELAFDFALHHLRPGGHLIMKIFQGAGFDELLLQLRQSFRTVKIRKPAASRPQSKEVYFVALDKR